MTPLTTDQWILLAVFAGTVLLMFWARLRPDLVAIMAALTLAITGVIPHGEVLSGLNSSVVAILLGLFILAHGLEGTGVIRWAAGRLSQVGGTSARRTTATLMGAASGLSLAMNNTAVGALFLPVTVRVAAVSGLPISSLLLPVAYATLLGGMATFFTSANIIMSDLLEQRGEDALGMIDFVVTGGTVALVGMLWLLVWGRRLLPSRELADDDPDGDYFGLYKLGERFWVFHVTPGSALDGKTIEETAVGQKLGVTILAIRRRHGRTLLVPGPGIAILSGDDVVVLGREERVRTLLDWGVELRAGSSPEQLADELELTEAVVSPRSRARGKTLADLQLRSRFGITALALWRRGEIIRTDVGRTSLEVGDALLVVNLPHRLEALARGGDFLVAGSRVAAPAHPERAPVAVGIFALVLAGAVSGALPIPEVVLAGAVAMVLTGCVSMEDAYRAIEWHVIFLVAGLLPLGFAMIDTGLADRAAGLLGGFADTADPLLVVAAMFVMSTAVTQVIGSQVSALLVGPVALAVAAGAGISLQAMAVAVAIGASTAFLTPMAHPINAMVMGAGGYRPSHFLRIGLGLTLVTLVSLLAGMWVFWGVR